MRLGVIVGKFHKDLAELLVADALRQARESSVILDPILWVPGSYELPLVAQQLLERPDLDGLVVLGFIERGQTQHGEQMGLTVSRVLKELELRARKPIGMGLIGPGATEAQARKRIGYAGRAVAAAAEMVRLLRP